MNHDTRANGSFSDYREFPAPLPLADHVLCFWTQSIVGSHTQYLHRVLPDGCIDIVFVNDDPPMVVGPWTGHFVARLAAGTNIVGARFHPGRASSLLHVPAGELLNHSVPLRDLWGSSTNDQFARVADRPDPASRKLALANTLIERLQNFAPVDRQVDASIQWLARNPHGKIEQLSRLVGSSNRHLQRRFSAAVGYGPKMLQSVMRFQRLLKFARERETAKNLADLSAEAGYADQSHMTREVQRFSGSPPTSLLRSSECTVGTSNFFTTPRHTDT